MLISSVSKLVLIGLLAWLPTSEHMCACTCNLLFAQLHRAMQYRRLRLGYTSTRQDSSSIAARQLHWTAIHRLPLLDRVFEKSGVHTSMHCAFFECRFQLNFLLSGLEVHSFLVPRNQPSWQLLSVRPSLRGQPPWGPSVARVQRVIGFDGWSVQFTFTCNQSSVVSVRNRMPLA